MAAVTTDIGIKYFPAFFSFSLRTGITGYFLRRVVKRLYRPVVIYSKNSVGYTMKNVFETVLFINCFLNFIVPEQTRLVTNRYPRL